jgi:hypothetical protein
LGKSPRPFPTRAYLKLRAAKDASRDPLSQGFAKLLLPGSP